jgi:hypothetical protein
VLPDGRPPLSTPRLPIAIEASFGRCWPTSLYRFWTSISPSAQAGQPPAHGNVRSGAAAGRPTTDLSVTRMTGWSWSQGTVSMPRPGTPGSEGGPRKPTSGNTGRAPRADPTSTYHRHPCHAQPPRPIWSRALCASWVWWPGYRPLRRIARLSRGEPAGARHGVPRHQAPDRRPEPSRGQTERGRWC